jgi:steroid delta-isomerase-like uncharacterized protein
MSQATSDLINRFIEEVWNSGEITILNELVDNEYIVNGKQVGRNWIAENVASFRTTFPDLTVTIQSMVSQDDRVAALMVLKGTHLGVWRGIPATGKQVEFREAGFWTISNGKILSGDFVAESLSMRIQLSQIPPSIWHDPPLEPRPDHD